MKRTNIIDVLNEQRTNESVKYQLTKKYLIIGIICLISGILIAGVGIQVYSRLTKQTLGAWVNLFYLLSLFGFVSNSDVCGCGTQKRAKSSEIL